VIPPARAKATKRTSRPLEAEAQAVTIDLFDFRLEAHVRSAMALAVHRASGEAIDAAEWLRAAVFIAESEPSPAFEQLRALLPGQTGDEPPQPHPAPFEPVVRVTPALRHSWAAAQPFLGEPHELWGRDYITIGLLAEDDGVEELARSAGSSAAELRQQWLQFVVSSDTRRSPEAWRAWWAEAGVPADVLPDVPSDVPSNVVASDAAPATTEFTPEAPEHSPGLANILRTAANAAPQPLSAADVLVAVVQLGQPGAEPAWAADFLTREVSGYQRFDRAAARATSRPEPTGLESSSSFESSSVAMPSPVATSQPGDSVQATPGLAVALAAAAALAQQTTGGTVVFGRHLLAALVTSPPAGPPAEPESLALLNDAGVDLALLRQRLYDWLRGFGDDDAAWFAILIGGSAPRLRAGFDADGSTGPDLLNIEPEVQALATLVAARDSLPPLSVGLFGDWGSGKTFFMRRLQKAVEALSREARQADAMQRDLPFFKRVVQIEFNAWHYTEGNLWASLMEHILANLRVGDEAGGTLTEELQRHWIERLGFAEQARAGADGERADAEREVGQAQGALQQAAREHEARQNELAELSAAAVRRDFQLSGVSEVVRSALAPLGLEALGASASELQAALSRARGVLQHGHGVLTPLLCAPDRAARWRRLLAVLAGPPLAALVVGWAVSRIGSDVMAQLSAAATGATALLTGGAAWLRRQAAWMAEQIGRVDAAQRQYDAELREALAQAEADKARAAQALARAQQKLAQAEVAALAARQRVADAQADLAAATTTRLLGQFIQDRAESSDYRKHLGVLAVVRQDFEKLSRFIEEENWRLAPPADGDERYTRTLRKLATLEEEDREARTRINRIVLYIDDLDRCPPAKVVEVLQAVHLLLAFPLFVVVVGVDARWVSRSLETRYRELLHADDADASAEHLFGTARSRDYLEKIFQIPLWLRPMGRADAQRMVYGMLSQGARTSALPAKQAAAADGAQPMRAESPATAPGNAAAPLDAANAARPEPTSPSPQPAAASPAGTRSAESATAVAMKTAAHLQQAEQMRVGPHEQEAIDRLSPLLGRSPRSIKRFVNVYRLIKAGLAPAELAGFARPAPHGLPPHEAVLLLLAVDTGMPGLSRDLYEALAERIGSKDGVHELLRWLDARHQDQPQPEWRRLREWLDRERRRLDAAAMHSLADWAPRVSRYSFQSPHGERSGS